MGKSESEIESWLGRRLKALGCLYYKFVSPGNDGVPDRIVITPNGETIYVELKTEDGVLSMAQELQLRRLRTKMAKAEVIYGIHGAEDFYARAEYAVIHGTPFLVRRRFYEYEERTDWDL